MEIKSKINELYEMIEELPDSREKEVALTHLKDDRVSLLFILLMVMKIETSMVNAGVILS